MNRGITSRANRRIDAFASARPIIPKFTCSEAEFEAGNLAFVIRDGVANVVRRTDPGRAFFHLQLERLLGDDLDRLLVIRIVARGNTRHPFGGRLHDRLEILVERLARDGCGLFAAGRAIHVEGEHDLAASGMAGLFPGRAVALDQVRHVRPGERNAHEMMPEPAGVLE